MSRLLRETRAHFLLLSATEYSCSELAALSTFSEDHPASDIAALPFPVVDRAAARRVLTGFDSGPHSQMSTDCAAKDQRVEFVLSVDVGLMLAAISHHIVFLSSTSGQAGSTQIELARFEGSAALKLHPRLHRI